jgi:hypothetical protein
MTWEFDFWSYVIGVFIGVTVHALIVWTLMDKIR